MEIKCTKYSQNFYVLQYSVPFTAETATKLANIQWNGIEIYDADFYQNKLSNIEIRTKNLLTSVSKL